MPVVASTLNIDCLEPINIANVNPNRWVQHLRPGKHFATCDGQMVLVVRVEGNTVYGVLDDSWHDVTYDINEAAQLLQSYIS
jgi:hypothetical protein